MAKIKETPEEAALGKFAEDLTLTRSTIGGEVPNPWYGSGINSTVGRHTWGNRFVDTVYLNNEGLKHRIYGPAYINSRHGIVEWYKEGKLHREDGPAHVHAHFTAYYYEGKLHRIGGPAITSASGPKQYWIHGQRMTRKIYDQEMARRRRKGLL